MAAAYEFLVVTRCLLVALLSGDSGERSAGLTHTLLAVSLLAACLVLVGALGRALGVHVIEVAVRLMETVALEPQRTNTCTMSELDEDGARVMCADAQFPTHSVVESLR